MIEVIHSSKGMINKTDINKKFPKNIVWINSFNLGNNDINLLNKRLGIHKYVLKHFLDSREIPRIEQYKTHDIIILKFLINKKIKTLGIIKHKNYILTVCSENINIEIDGEAFKDSNTLLKDILNNLIKNFSERLQKVEDDTNYLEDITFDEKIDNDPKQIFNVKKELMYLKKALKANKEIISKIKYFEDVHLEINQLVDTENTLSSRITSVMEMYMSFSSNKLNEIMKSFTVIASLLLIPMLISGIYGMNVLLPLGNVEGAFFIILGIMLFFMVLMLIYFKIKKWA